MKPIPRLAVLLALVVAPLGVAIADQPVPASHGRFSVIARFDVGGTDIGYDFLSVDAAAHRLYIAHRNRVDVLSLPAGTRIGEVAGMQGVHGIEIIASLGKGYTSDGLDRAVTVFDRQSLAVLRRIQQTGIKPDAILYDPHSDRLYVVNGGESGDVTVIDPRTDSIVATVELSGGKLEQIGFDGRGHAYVNDEQKSVVHVFDTATLTKVAQWKPGTCEEPTGLAVDAGHHRLYSVCGNHVMAVLDSDDGHLVTQVTIGSDPDGVVYDAARSLLFVSNREGTLDVIRQRAPDSYTRIQSVKTGPGARTVALDPESGRVYVPTAQFADAPAGGGRKDMVPSSFAVLVVGAASPRGARSGSR